MNFLLDENFPKAVIPFLETQGHSATDFRCIGPRGASDQQVIRTAIDKSAAVLTTDRDFFHTLGRIYPQHFGIIVVALKKPTRDAIISRITWFLNCDFLASLPARTFQLRDHTWMVYPPLEEK